MPSSSDRHAPPGQGSSRARRAAAELSQSARVADRRRTWAWRVFAAVVAVAVAATLTVAFVSARRGASSTASADGLSRVSGIGAATPPPWLAPSEVPPRVATAGLRLGRMGTAEHYHAHLDVRVDGHEVAVPENVGVDATTGLMSALHTHTPDGVVHIEADMQGQVFTLGQLFTEWNVRLTPSQVGSFTVSVDKELVVYVNGELRPGDPALLRLEPNQEIALLFGTPRDNRDFPKSYDFTGL